MGAAAYNRGSKAIRDQISQEMKGVPVRIAYEPKPVFEPVEKPKLGPLGYWNLTNDPDRKVQVGDRVYCTVTQCKGWMTVTQVKGSYDGLRIKTDTFARSWGYGHNFTFNPPAWMLK